MAPDAVGVAVGGYPRVHERSASFKRNDSNTCSSPGGRPGYLLIHRPLVEQREIVRLMISETPRMFLKRNIKSAVCNSELCCVVAHSKSKRIMSWHLWRAARAPHSPLVLASEWSHKLPRGTFFSVRLGLVKMHLVITLQSGVLHLGHAEKLRFLVCRGLEFWQPSTTRR